MTPSGELKNKVFDVSNYDSDLCTLLLRPLSSITEEEAIQCAQAGFNEDTLASTDWLRSKGFALPFMGISVEEMVQNNWIKLKTE